MTTERLWWAGSPGSQRAPWGFKPQSSNSEEQIKTKTINASHNLPGQKPSTLSKATLGHRYQKCRYIRSTQSLRKLRAPGLRRLLITSISPKPTSMCVNRDHSNLDRLDNEPMGLVMIPSHPLLLSQREILPTLDSNLSNGPRVEAAA
jgi:hypothetical protein